MTNVNKSSSLMDEFLQFITNYCSLLLSAELYPIQHAQHAGFIVQLDFIIFFNLIFHQAFTD